MTVETDSLILLPLPPEAPIDVSADDQGAATLGFAWWRCAGGKCVQHGENGDVLSAIDRAPGDEAGPVTLLLPADICAVRTHRLTDMTAPQAQAAARMAALDNSISPNTELHVAALVISSDERADGEIEHTAQSAVVARPALQALLNHCQALGLDPDHIYPAALVAAPQESDCFRFILGPYCFLRAPDVAADDDPALRGLLTDDSDCAVIGDDAVLAAIGNLPMRSLPDLRQGDFASTTDRALMAPREKRLLYALAAMLAIATLVIPGIRLLRYQSANETLVNETVAKAQQLLPTVTDLNSAEQQVDAALLARVAGPRIFSAPSAALFSLVQALEDITIRDMGYRPDGTLTAVIAAPDNDTINQLLIPIQEQGYIVTVSQRQEAGGAAVIDLTVRG